MALSGQILIILFAVHVLTVASLFLVKRSKISENFRSSPDHPANIGYNAIQLGGLVIIPVTLCACLVTFYTLGNIPLNTQLVFCIPIFLLFLIGIIDDFRPLPAWMRLSIHIVNAISVTIIILGITQYSGLEALVSTFGFFIPSLFMVLAISWMINAVNFIDGMDLFLVVNIIPGCLLFSALGLSSSEYYHVSSIFMIFTSSLLGFTWYNRPKASIYMGDAGTLCIGFLLGSCAVYILAKYGSISGFIPFTYILIDTTFTLIKRATKGENILNSHNRHAYQIANRNGKGENLIRITCFAVSIINTGLAYFCFILEHSIYAQFLLGGIACILSTLVFFFFRKSKISHA